VELYLYSAICFHGVQRRIYFIHVFCCKGKENELTWKRILSSSSEEFKIAKDSAGVLSVMLCTWTFLDFHRGTDEVFVLLGCDASLLGNQFPTFRENVLASH
jgi:hypothetical protein